MNFFLLYLFTTKHSLLKRYFSLFFFSNCNACVRIVLQYVSKVALCKHPQANGIFTHEGVPRGWAERVRGCIRKKQLLHNPSLT